MTDVIININNFRELFLVPKDWIIDLSILFAEELLGDVLYSNIEVDEICTRLEDILIDKSIEIPYEVVANYSTYIKNIINTHIKIYVVDNDEYKIINHYFDMDIESIVVSIIER